jgi:hypothetical protein
MGAVPLPAIKSLAGWAGVAGPIVLKGPRTFAGTPASLWPSTPFPKILVRDREPLRRMDVGEPNIFGENGTAKVQLVLPHRLWRAQHRLERSFSRAQQRVGTGSSLPPRGQPFEG